MNWQAISFDGNQVRAVLATVEEGSFSGAARALRTTQPTIGRQVTGLEQSLGVTLFERTVRGPVLTEAGRDLVDHVRTMGDATNMKQRTRKQIEYYHAGRLNYAVAGTPNRLEYDQGFFVKNGDGAADFKPIAHLYKTQVHQLAEALDIPEEISSRPPTTDTWSLAQSQEEFYFSLPYNQMDLCLYGLNQGLAASEVATAVNLTSDQVERVWRDIAAKRKATRYLHERPLLIDKVALLWDTSE